MQSLSAKILFKAKTPPLDFFAALERGVSKKANLVTVYFMRHGATKFNNQTDMSQDRVRSWNDVPLADDGRKEAHKTGKKLAKYGIKVIVSSSLGRAKETARIVKKEIGDPDIKIINTPKMLPWNLGKFTGQTTDEAHDGIKHYIEHPDEVVPDGESFNDFRARAFSGMVLALKQAGEKPLLVISHHRNERLFATSGKPPRLDADIDAEKFLRPGEDPGDVTTFDFDLRRLSPKNNAVAKLADINAVTKIWDSNDELPDSVKSSLPQEAQTVFRRVANDRMKAGHGEVSAIRQAWTAIKNGWRKDGDNWVRKFAIDDESLELFIEQQQEILCKQDDDEINAALHLYPHDDDADMAKTPFPWDQNALSNLRPDQTPRFLAALTDPQRLPIKVVRLNSLVAIQNRVDPNKVQSMVDEEPDVELPVVVRFNDRNIIADGHHRLAAHLLTGRKTAPVRFADLTAEDNAVKRDVVKLGDDDDQDDWFVPFQIVAKSDDQQLVFGFASVSSINEHHVIDKQGDIIPRDELENAVYDYVLYCRKQGDMHERVGIGRLVESMVFTKEKENKLNEVCKQLAEEMRFDFKPISFGGFEAWWAGYKVDDLGVWKRIKDGDLPEFSIGGKAIRESVDPNSALRTASTARVSSSKPSAMR